MLILHCYFCGMAKSEFTRKDEIIRLIAERLSEVKDVEYVYNGPVTTLDKHLIMLDYAIKHSYGRLNFSIRTFIDEPLRLRAEIQNDGFSVNLPAIKNRIEDDLRLLSAELNRII